MGRTLGLIGQFRFAKPGWLAPGPKVTAPVAEGNNPILRFVDLCVSSPNFQRRTASNLRERISRLVWSWVPEFAKLNNEAGLVHGDFGKRNLLLHGDGSLPVNAVLDWELAVSGSPLTDMGHFLRYETDVRPNYEGLAQNGARREPVPNPFGGARRTLCASKEHAQNGVRREPVPNPLGGARRTLGALEPHFSNGYLEAGGSLPERWREMARLLDLAGLCESLTHHELPDDITAELVELVSATAWQTGCLD